MKYVNGEGAAYWFRLLPEQDILLADGEYGPARPLEFSTAETYQNVATFWIGSDYKVVRKDTYCLQRNPECSENLVSYSDAGEPAPFGIGLPLALSSSDTLHVDGMRVDAEKGGTATGVRVTLSAHWPVLSESLVSSADYLYDESPAPYQILLHSAVGDAPAEWRRESAALASSLPELVNPTLRILGERNNGAYALFPGENQDDLGRGYRHIDPYEFLLSASPSASEAASVGCLVELFERPLRPPPPNLIGALQPKPLDSFSYSFALGDGEVRRWSVIRERNVSGDIGYRVGQEGELSERESSCERRANLGFNLTSSTAFDKFRALNLTFQWLPTFRLAFYQSDPSMPGQADLRLEFLLAPSSVDLNASSGNFAPRYVLFDVDTGLMEYAHIDPVDHERLGLSPGGHNSIG